MNTPKKLDTDSAGAKKRKRKNRCFVCKTSVGLLGFGCRCNKEILFCSKHRYPEDHNCSFDYQEMQREKIEKENPKIVSDKLLKI